MKKVFTDAEVEIEIERLLHSDEVILAKKEAHIRNRRRQYMYSLRTMERRGRQLVAEGVTLDNIQTKLFGNTEDWEEDIYE